MFVVEILNTHKYQFDVIAQHTHTGDDYDGVRVLVAQLAQRV